MLPPSLFKFQNVLQFQFPCLFQFQPLCLSACLCSLVPMMPEPATMVVFGPLPELASMTGLAPSPEPRGLGLFWESFLLGFLGVAPFRGWFCEVIPLVMSTMCSLPSIALQHSTGRGLYLPGCSTVICECRLVHLERGLLSLERTTQTWIIVQTSC